MCVCVACLLNYCLFNAEYYLYTLIIMTYAASDHWPLKDGLRIGHLNINHLINKMSGALTLSTIVNHMAGVFSFFLSFFLSFSFSSESRLNNHIKTML